MGDEENIRTGSVDRAEFHEVAEALGVTTADVTGVTPPGPDGRFRAIYTDSDGRYVSRWLERDRDGVPIAVSDPGRVPDFLERMGRVAELTQRRQALERERADSDAKLASLPELRERVESQRGGEQGE